MNTPIRSFEDLECWKAGRELRLFCPQTHQRLYGILEARCLFEEPSWRRVAPTRQ